MLGFQTQVLLHHWRVGGKVLVCRLNHLILLVLNRAGAKVNF